MKVPVIFSNKTRARLIMWLLTCVRIAWHDWYMINLLSPCWQSILHFHPIKIFFHSFWCSSSGIAWRGAVIAVITFEPRFLNPISQIILKRPLHYSKTREYCIKWLSSTVAWHDGQMIMSCHLAGGAYYWQQLGMFVILNMLSLCLQSILFFCLVDIQT